MYINYQRVVVIFPLHELLSLEGICTVCPMPDRILSGIVRLSRPITIWPPFALDFTFLIVFFEVYKVQLLKYQVFLILHQKAFRISEDELKLDWLLQNHFIHLKADILCPFA